MKVIFFYFFLIFFYIERSFISHVYSLISLIFAAVGVSGGTARRTKRAGRDAAARRKEQRRVAAAEAEAEAVEALAEIAAGPSIAGSDMAESSSGTGDGAVT